MGPHHLAKRVIININIFYITIIFVEGRIWGGGGHCILTEVTDPPTRKMPLIRASYPPPAQTHLPALDTLHDLPFSLVRGLLSPERISVALRQQEGDEEQPRPYLGTSGRRTTLVYFRY